MIYRTRCKQAKHYTTDAGLEPMIYPTRCKQAKHYTTDAGLEPMIYRTRCKQTKHYTTDTVHSQLDISEQLVKYIQSTIKSL
jgi:hypothetical protein